MVALGTITGAIKMLQALRKNEILNINELADIIGCKPRTVRKYRQDLVKCNYNIVSKRGKNGGYMLLDVKITDDDVVFLHEIKNQLPEELKNDYSAILKKIEYLLFDSI